MTGVKAFAGTTRMVDLRAVRMGRSRGGLTTKIHAVTDARGLPIALKLTAGQAPLDRLLRNRLPGNA
ncbi:hypothetical protein N0B44_03990 [Roseibacterium beibuensis]|uniref:Transposase n=1 Tax=[Roseibacterium] beibuensis TaxID=1193142 RepID=A0ABP9KV02_9RHOB|nr:hypothetical protein [Roseibacterium beibuensis]MCS6622067.1 hypothetical protein [Roseibacterium beibuensis]